KPADSLTVEHGLQQHHHRLLVSIPTVPQRFAEETVAQSKKFRARPLGVLTEFLRLGGKPIVKQRESSVGINQLLGIAVIGRNLTDAYILLQFEANLGQIVQPAQNFLADSGAIIEVAGNQPI